MKEVWDVARENMNAKSVKGVIRGLILAFLAFLFVVINAIMFRLWCAKASKALGSEINPEYFRQYYEAGYSPEGAVRAAKEIH